MKRPRDVSGLSLVNALRVLGYAVDRQRGSHIRVTTQQDGEHHEVVPSHNPIKIGTLSSILKSIAAHHKLTVEERYGNSTCSALENGVWPNSVTFSESHPANVTLFGLTPSATALPLTPTSRFAFL